MAERFETVALRTSVLPDGRRFLADIELNEYDAGSFVERYKLYWERDHTLQGWVLQAVNGENAKSEVSCDAG